MGPRAVWPREFLHKQTRNAGVRFCQSAGNIRSLPTTPDGIP